MERRFTEMPISFSLIRHSLQQKFSPNKAPEVNSARVENFIRNQEIDVKPYVLFKQSELPKVRKIIGTTNLLRQGYENGALGMYVPELDLVFLMREDDYEEANGPLYTEGLLAHELAHASSQHSTFVRASLTSVYVPRVGFCLPQKDALWGWFLEEGFADMMRGKYVAENMTSDQKKRLEDSMKFPDLEMDSTLSLPTPHGYSVPLPFKYTYLTPQLTPASKPSSYAAYGVELLCQKDPELMTALKEARRSKDGLRSVARRINALALDLYPQLQRSEYTEANFSDRLNHIIGTLYGDIRTVIKSNGRLTEVWNQVLAK